MNQKSDLLDYHRMLVNDPGAGMREFDAERQRQRTEESLASQERLQVAQRNEREFSEQLASAVRSVPRR